jgi:hypothetical protein
VYEKTITFKHGVKSYDIIEYILNTLFPMNLNTLLLYRYKEPLNCRHALSIKAEVKFFRRSGFVYYGVCNCNKAF